MLRTLSSDEQRVLEASARFAPVLRQVAARGVQVVDTYGSPVYLGQYLKLHAAVSDQVRRIEETTGVKPLVVDWGAGVGHCAFVRHELGDRLIAHALTDPQASPYTSVLEHVCDLNGIELRASADPVTLPFADGEVGVLISCGVLEHVHEGGGSVEASLAEIERVLQPGGAFVCGHLPHSRSWIEWVNRRTGRSHHDKTFAPGEVRALGRSGLAQTGRALRYGVIPRIQVARRLQRGGRDRIAAAVTFERLDRLASRLLPVIAQNNLLVFRKADRTAT